MSDTREFDPQAAPTAGDGRDVMAEVVREVEKRAAFGRRKYGTAMMSPWNGRDALQDLIDELTDGLAYAIQLRMQRDAAGPPTQESA